MGLGRVKAVKPNSGFFPSDEGDIEVIVQYHLQIQDYQQLTACDIGDIENEPFEEEKKRGLQEKEHGVSRCSETRAMSLRYDFGLYVSFGKAQCSPALFKGKFEEAVTSFLVEQERSAARQVEIGVVVGKPRADSLKPALFQRPQAQESDTALLLVQCV